MMQQLLIRKKDLCHCLTAMQRYYVKGKGDIYLVAKDTIPDANNSEVCKSTCMLLPSSLARCITRQEVWQVLEPVVSN